MKTGIYITEVQGVPSGMVVGHVYDRDTPVWEVIKHAGNNYTVRQPDASNDKGIVIPVPERLAFTIFNKIGIFRINGQKPPWPDVPVIWKNPDRRTKVVRIGDFVDAAWELFENSVGAAYKAEQAASAAAR